ncbi:MAG: metallo cofactor biosynthesis protein, partial [Lachnospiraceae bacterium]|nr:metallo cofactor biosynthesis protein [Lachnospiraceae bacterium]
MKLSSFFHFAGFGIKTILFKKKTPILGTVIVTDKCNL